MNASFSVRSAVLFLGLPALWLGSVSLTERFDPAQQNPELEFIPVAVHAFHAANYSVDKSIRFTPIDEDIVEDAQGDQEEVPPMVPPPTSGAVVTPVPTKKSNSDSGGSSGGTVSSTPLPGNKNKEAGAPGKSGQDHGNGGSGSGHGK